MSRLLHTLKLPGGFDDSQRFILFCEIHDLDSGKPLRQLIVYLIRKGFGSHQTQLFNHRAGSFEFLVQLFEINDGRVGVFFLGNHENRETVSVFDRTGHEGKRLALRTAQEDRLPVHRN